jgi:endonuclease/exonuclease/phosphatase family metal-dependent hydrolase
MRVMTFNVRGGLGMDGQRSMERIAQVIDSAEVDLVAVQELHQRLPHSGFVDQPRRLARLTGLEALFRPSFSLGIGAYGNAWLTRLPVVRLVRRRLPGVREPRAVLDLELLVDGVPVRALGTHFGLQPEEKLAQARHLAALIQAADLPTVVLGDLNAAPDSAELAPLWDAGLSHAVPPESPSWPADDPRHRIDHILVSRHWRVDDGAVLATEVSDHLPLVATLSLIADRERFSGTGP